jgi:hypothetical protein
MNEFNGQGERNGYWVWGINGTLCCRNYLNGLFHGECKDIKGSELLRLNYCKFNLLIGYSFSNYSYFYSYNNHKYFYI